MGTTYQLAVFVGLDERGRRRYRYETVRGSCVLEFVRDRATPIAEWVT
jgi:hypothetical protein